MQLVILACGSLRSDPLQPVYLDYCQRAAKLGPRLGISKLLHEEIPWPKGQNALLQADKKLTQRASGSNRRIYLMDERGEDLTSREWANLLKTSRDEAFASLFFVLGGPEGHGPEMKKLADRHLAFGRATWPHRLARVMLAEQIYRALTILASTPYHK